jgi:branched-chain amino acid transport system ATP-binding protein
MSALLEVSAQEAGYGPSKVLFGVDLSIGQGEVATLLGRNGMGKTTTVKAMLGLLRSAGGAIRFRGERIERWTADRIARAGVAVVPEGRQIFPNLSVEENLVAFAANRSGAGAPWTRDRVYAMFPRLQERRRNLGNQLSGGEQQMLAIGRALTLNPKVLLLDEPTEGLAPIIVEELLRALGTITRSGGICSIIVEQNAQKILGLADRVVILERGAIVHDAASHALKADPAVLERYLGVAGAAAH